MRLTLILFLLYGACCGQADVLPLFSDKEPLSIRLSFSVKELKKNTNDTVYTASVLYYKATTETWDSLKIDLRARGHFRRANCAFPPLKIKIKKYEAKNTPLAGNKSLKLVVPCQSGKGYNNLVLKEYLAYQLYQHLTPYCFNTRLVNLSLTDGRGKNSKTHQLSGFFIEDDDLLAKRLNGKLYPQQKIHPSKLADSATVLVDFFEYMISNSDWSAVQLHNIKVVQLKSQLLIPVAYDFDMSGLVNAPYGQVSELVGTASVRERVYRGFCRNPELFEYARSVYLKLEPSLLEVVDRFNGLPPTEVTDIKRYLEGFFSTLKNDRSFKENIVQKCRTK